MTRGSLAIELFTRRQSLCGKGEEERDWGSGWQGMGVGSGGGCRSDDYVRVGGKPEKRRTRAVDDHRKQKPTDESRRDGQFDLRSMMPSVSLTVHSVTRAPASRTRRPAENGHMTLCVPRASYFSTDRLMRTSDLLPAAAADAQLQTQQVMLMQLKRRLSHPLYGPLSLNRATNNTTREEVRE